MRPAVLLAFCLPLLLPAEGQPPSAPPTPTSTPPQEAAETHSAARRSRFFFGLIGGRAPCRGQCPIHVCDIDPAVVHGYCCGCARFLDRVPFTCPGSLTCPLDISQLCRDYDFMMDCCC